VNAAEVVIDGANIADVYSPALSDSQAIGILNTPGPVAIRNSTLSAGSEVIMVGGDSMKVAGAVPTGILIENNTVYRPLTWQTDGINRGVKNLLELKAGVNVTIRGNQFRGNWAAAQPGYAIVITPKNRQEIHNVLFESNDVRDVAAVFNVLGQDYNTYTASGLSGLVIRNNRFQTDKATFGGNGWLIQAGANPGDVTFETNVAITDGTALVSFYFGSVMLADEVTKVPGGKWTSLKMIGNYLVAGTYGLSLAGYMNGANWQAAVVELDFSLNTVTSRSATESYTKMQPAFPNNTYIPRVDWDVLVAR
jgi:hypothetical protein